PAEVVLRTRSRLEQLGQRGELGLRQLFDHARGENRGVALRGDAQQKADLLVEHIALARRRWSFSLGAEHESTSHTVKNARWRSRSSSSTAISPCQQIWPFSST